VKTYDPDQYDIVFAGFRLNEGVSDGTILTVTPSAQKFSKKVGVLGSHTRNRLHDKSGTARLVVQKTSETNDILSRILRADQAATNGQGVATFLVQDRAGTTVIQSAKAYIAQEPELTLEAEVPSCEWLFELSDVDWFTGGNPDD
jgi:hypothetical protein